MVSKIEVDTVVNQSGDQDSGLDLSTNDVVAVKTANTERMQINANTVSIKSKASSYEGLELITPSGDGSGQFHIGVHDDGGSSGRTIVISRGGSDGMDTESMRIDASGNVNIGSTNTGIQVSGISMTQDGNIDIGAGVNPLDVNRQTNDGSLIRFYQASSEEGEITVSGSTVSLSGFQGSHESSGIPSDTPIGTVVSTIDTVDTKTIIAKDGSKSQQDRADHPKIEVSSSVGDKAVYGVFSRWRTIEENEDVKAMIASVGTGSVRVTGACAKGDLLESNGDGTAKVQSDDIVRSKTIGKVTIGNSSTDVKLVSCVLYCG